MQKLSALGPIGLKRLTGLREIVQDLPPFWFLDEALNPSHRGQTRAPSDRCDPVVHGRRIDEGVTRRELESLRAEGRVEVEFSTVGGGGGAAGY